MKGFAVEVDYKGDNLNKKIRNAQLEGFNYIGVIGKEEAQTKTINLRKRDESKEIGKIAIADLLELFESLKPPKSKLRMRLEEQAI